MEFTGYSYTTIGLLRKVNHLTTEQYYLVIK